MREGGRKGRGGREGGKEGEGGKEMEGEGGRKGVREREGGKEREDQDILYITGSHQVGSWYLLYKGIEGHLL